MRTYGPQEQEKAAEDMAHYERGMYAADPKALECITIYVSHLMPDRVAVRHIFANIPFWYGDGGVVFGETFRVSSEDEEHRETAGNIQDVIDAVFSAGNN